MLKYTEDHEWLRPEGDEITVGITRHASEQLGDVVFIELPEVGRQVAAGEEIVVIESVKAASDIVAPVAGTITSTDNQPRAAGYYIVEKGADGHDYFFAHCQEASTAVKAGDVVTPGQALCRVGHTGDATGPHLHFEAWVNGWRTGPASAPIDPLPLLKSWDTAR